MLDKEPNRKNVYFAWYKQPLEETYPATKSIYGAYLFFFIHLQLDGVGNRKTHFKKNVYIYIYIYI